MQEEGYKRYAEIKNQIKELGQEARDIEESVLGDMTDKGLKQVKSDAGTFSLMKRTYWEYSGNINVLELKVKEAKKEEVESGKAESKESTSLMFRTNKK